MQLRAFVSVCASTLLAGVALAQPGWQPTLPFALFTQNSLLPPGQEAVPDLQPE